jgi:hypothetical protein
MALTGSGHLADPSASGQSMADTGPYRIDPGPESVKIALWLHANNASAIRTAVSTQIYTLVKTVKKGSYKPMSPHPHRSATGATLRPLPLKIFSLAINFVEKN